MAQQMEIVLADTIPGIGKAGQKVSLSLTETDVHAPEEMATYLAGWAIPGGFRADEASPPILVDTDEDKYRTFDSDDAFKRVQVKGSPQGAIPEIDPLTSLSSYKVVDRFVGSFVQKVTELNAVKAFQPKAAAARRCKRALMLDREMDVWTLLTTVGNWNGTNVNALSAGQKWNGGASSDPLLDIQYLLENSAQQVSDLWMSYKTANAFMRHASVRDQMRQMLGDSMPGQQLANLNMAVAKDSRYDFQLPGLPPIHVVGAKVKDASGVLGPVLGDSFVVATTSPPGVPTDGEEIATTYTFRRKSLSGVGFEAREFEIPFRSVLGGTMLVASMADVAVITANNVGGLITGAVV